MNRLMRMLGYETIGLSSPLSAGDCVDRLRQRVGSRWSLFSDRPVVGRVGDSSFQIRKRLTFFHNSFQTYLKGDIASVGATTLVNCRLGMHPLVVAFVVIWLGVVCLMAIVSTFATITTPAHGDEFAIFPPVFMLAFGIALVALGRLMARNERRFLLDFLRDAIEAHEIAPGHVPGAVERRKTA